MSRKKLPHYFLFFISLIFLWSMPLALMAQDKVDPDERFKVIRKLILDGNRAEGRRQAKIVLESYPNYTDYYILIGRSYTWDGKYDSANFYFEKAIQLSPLYEDAYIGFLENLFNAEDYEKADQVLKTAFSSVGENSLNLQYAKSRLLYYKKDYKSAMAIANDLFNKDAKIDGLLNYIRNLQRFTQINAIGAIYDHDSFGGSLTPWDTYTVYGRTRTKVTGALIGRVTHTNRFDATGTQYELDAFPSLGKKSYGYFNVGFSNAFFFPSFRFGTSIYWNLKNAWEIEAGYRLLAFSENTHVITPSIGKYLGSWWFNFRLNYIPSKAGASTSGNLQTRYYFKGAEDFLSLQLSTGVSPDEQNRDFQSQLLNSYRARLGYQHLWTQRWMGFGFVGYSRDEITSGNFRNNLNISIGTEIRF